jgi:hypothetical protein
MKITFLPITKLGKWSVILMISSWILFAVGSVLPWKPGYSGFEIVVQNPLQGIITVLMLIIGIATFVTALNSVSKYRERSLLVFLAILGSLYSIPGFVGSLVNVFFNQG